MGGRVGVMHGDNVKLRHNEGSGACDTGRGVLQGVTSTASAGSSWTTEMNGSECVGAFDSGTVSDWHAGFPSAWVPCESTSLTGEKQRETFTVSFLFWVD